MNPCRGIGGSHRKLLDGAGGKLATVATSPADSEESSLGVPEVAPPSSQHRNSITPPSVHAFVLILFVFLFFSHFVWSLYVLSFSFSLSLSRFALSSRLADTWIQTTPESESELAGPSFVPRRGCESRSVFRVSELRCFSRCSTKQRAKRTK